MDTQTHYENKVKMLLAFNRFSQMLDKMQQNDQQEMILNHINHKITFMLSNFCYNQSDYVANS